MYIYFLKQLITILNFILFSLVHNNSWFDTEIVQLFNVEANNSDLHTISPKSFIITENFIITLQILAYPLFEN